MPHLEEFMAFKVMCGVVHTALKIWLNCCNLEFSVILSRSCLIICITSALDEILAEEAEISQLYLFGKWKHWFQFPKFECG